MRPALLCAAALALCGAASAQTPTGTGTETAQVLQVTPIVVQETVPTEDCTDLPQQRQRCRTTRMLEERIQGYSVTYRHRGRTHTVELPYDPGPTVQVQTAPGNSQGKQYGSRPDVPTVRPGSKSYGSAPAAGGADSIEYHSPQPDIPIVVDVRTRPIAVPGTPQPRSPRPQP